MTASLALRPWRDRNRTTSPAGRAGPHCLAAARQAFAEHRLDAVAQRTGVDKRLIYYIQNKEAIALRIDFTWQYHLAHLEFIALINSENLHRAEGVFRGGVDPAHMSIAGLTYFFLSNRYTLAVTFGRTADAPKALAERISHVREVILGYLLK